MLTPRDIAELTAWRRDLHRHPEVSRLEAATAARVVAALQPLAPDQVHTGLGGHGVAAVFDSGHPGPSVMFRAELDALPITEISEFPHRSTRPGTGHLCGHDGHMALLIGLARLLARQRPARGRVILMFQPAEEDGSGAAAVLADPAFAALIPDWAFAIHNLPGVALGHALVKPGVVNCASQGLKITLGGKTAHASQPEAGTSPGLALAALITAFSTLAPPAPLAPGYRLVTVTHARLGAPAFGIAPGMAELWITLRTLEDEGMAALRAEAVALAETQARAHGLTLHLETHDDFAASVNHPEATAHITAALGALGIDHDPGDLPMRASEDFGRFGQHGTRSAMLFLGAGQTHPALHNPDYDFPDALIAPGITIFHQIAREVLG
jgi:amidohydrolase